MGARKIRERLLRRLRHAVKVPAATTVHALLDRHGLVKRMSRARTPAEGTPLSLVCSRTICGAPTTRASSNSVTNAIVIRTMAMGFANCGCWIKAQTL